MLSRLTDRSAVLEALNEFDEKGRGQFLGDSNFGASKRYFIRFHDQLYDAKAIAGRALEIQHADLSGLPHDAFQGGPPVKRRLEDLGFDVVLTSSPSRNESPFSGGDRSPPDDTRSSLTTGQRMRHVRAVLSMTQKQLGDELNVHQGTVSAWETDRVEPREGNVRALANMVEPSDRAFRWITLERKRQPTLRPKGAKGTAGTTSRDRHMDADASVVVSPPDPPGGSTNWPQQAGIFDDSESIAAARAELLDWMVEVVDAQPEAAAYATSLVNMFNAAVERIEKLDDPSRGADR